MEEENKIGYYAVIPSTILLNNDVKPNEKLLYAIITVLSNKEGYCFASNSYLGNLLNVQQHTVSKWVSHLKKLGYICIDIVRNCNNEIIQRKIYPNDTPYTIKRTYPYATKSTEGMSQKGQDNNIIDNNIKYKRIDRFFNYIIGKENKIPKEFLYVELDKIISALKKYELYYSKDIIDKMSKENLEKVKVISYIIALVIKNNLYYLSNKVNREKLIQLYNECKNRELENKNTDKAIKNFVNYYYKSVANELTKDVLNPSFFIKNNKLEDKEFIDEKK